MKQRLSDAKSGIQQRSGSQQHRVQKSSGASQATLGVLSKTRASIAVDPIRITAAKVQWGRGQKCTHVYDNGDEIRVSRAVFTIALWDPSVGHKATDLTKAHFHAVIANNGSRDIWVNDVPLTPKANHLRFGLLFSGDRITVFDDKEKNERLEFGVRFRFGNARYKRSIRDRPFEVFVLASGDEVDRAIAAYSAGL